MQSEKNCVQIDGGRNVITYSITRDAFITHPFAQEDFTYTLSPVNPDYHQIVMNTHASEEVNFPGRHYPFLFLSLLHLGIPLFIDQQ